MNGTEFKGSRIVRRIKNDKLKLHAVSTSGPGVTLRFTRRETDYKHNNA